MTIRFVLLFLLFSQVMGSKSMAQSQPFISLYKEQLPYFQELITGGAYKDPPKEYIGHPYYHAPEFEFGTLSINSVEYTEVPLLYNQNTDELVTFHPIYVKKIRIKSGKVEQFVFPDGEIFRRFENNPNYPDHQNGFYQVVSDGQLKILIKHHKSKEVYRKPGRITYTYMGHKDLFYWFDREFEEIKNQKKAIKVLGLNKKEVRTYLKEQKANPQIELQEFMLNLVHLVQKENLGFSGFAK